MPFIAALLAAAAAVLVTALLVTIVQRQGEAQNPFYRVVDLSEEVSDPAVWGQNFPLQYDGYRRTVDQVRGRRQLTVPRTPSQADPRSVVAQSRLEDDVRLKTMWARYVRLRLPRGARARLHARRPDVHGASAGDEAAGDLYALPRLGVCAMPPWRRRSGSRVRGHEPDGAGARKEVAPVACIDCHDPRTMQLRVTRPGFLKASAC